MLRTAQRLLLAIGMLLVGLPIIALAPTTAEAQAGTLDSVVIVLDVSEQARGQPKRRT